VSPGRTGPGRPRSCGGCSKPTRAISERYGAFIADLLRLGPLTGCSLTEICEPRAEDVLVERRAVRVRRGKTDNARRLVPVHALVWPVAARRLGGAAAGDGWLFPGLAPDRSEGKRS
jgi:integrase